VLNIETVKDLSNGARKEDVSGNNYRKPCSHTGGD
jgi:hypothetical protein